MPYTAAEYARSLMHRTALLELLGKIPADKGDFKAWEGGRTITETVDHLASTANGLVATAAGQKPERLPPSPDFPAALERLQAVTETMRQTLAGLSEAQLATEVPALGRTMPLHGLAEFLIQHDAHHKGQLWLTARLIGVEPPMFVKMG
ncbi:MAG: DinB family protein [Meiothermus sp.]